jgi:tetratricopeptide (TPR) repeat protein
MAKRKAQVIEKPNLLHEIFEGAHDFLIKNKVLLLVCLVVLVLVVASIAIYQKERRERANEAWYALSQAQTVEELEPLASEYAGTSTEPWIRSELGDALYDEGNVERAAEEYEKALQLPGLDIWLRKALHLNLAYAFEDMRKYDQAERELQRLAQLPGEDYWKREARLRLESLKEIMKEYEERSGKGGA